jgi:hypothetical protein
MTVRLQQFGREWQMDSEDYRNIKLVTLFSKRALAFVLSAAVVIVTLLGWYFPRRVPRASLPQRGRSQQFLIKIPSLTHTKGFRSHGLNSITP